MKFSGAAIKNPQITTLLLLMVIVLGISTIFNIPRSEDPEMSSPEFPVIIIYPGAAPKDIENLVIDPIEKRVSSLEGIRNVSSKIQDGVAVMNVAYNFDADVDEKYQEVLREINNIRSELPSDINSIEVQKWLPSNVNVLQVGILSANAPVDKMKKTAEQLQDELEKLPELKNVKIFGLPEKIVKVEMKLQKMAQLKIPAERIFNSIKSEAVSIPGGRVDAHTKVYNVQTSGSYKSLDEVKNTIVSAGAGSIVYLKDVADVSFDYKEFSHVTRLNGHRSLFVVAAQKPGENITETQKKYVKVIEDFTRQKPNNIDIVHFFDQADNVNRRLGGLGLDFLIAIALVSLTLLPLGYRAALIVMFSIPLSLSIGIVIISLLGYNLNQLSIVGFVVALGLLVDDSIVVTENIERWLREGHPLMDAVLKGVNQIGMAVLGCTATLIVAFLPLAGMPGSSGDFIRSLPVSVMASVLASMIVSLTFIPFIAVRLLKEHQPDSKGNFMLRILKKGISGSYTRVLDLALNNPWKAVFAALLIFSLSLALFPVIGFSLFPASEKPQFLVEVTTPLQSNIGYTDSITKLIEKDLRKVQEVKYFASNVGHGNPQIYYNVIPENERSDFSQIFVQLENNIKPARKTELIELLRNQWSLYPGAKIEVKDFEQGPPIVAPVEVRILGDNLDTLREIASSVAALLKKTEGTIYINNPQEHLKSDIKVVINKEKAGVLGVPIVSVDMVVRSAIEGLELGKIRDENGDDFKILGTKKSAKNNSLDAFDGLYVNSVSGAAIPLSQIAKLEFESSPLSIDHRDKVRIVSVSSFVQKGYLADNVVRDVKKQLDAIRLPKGYSFAFGGEVEQREQSFSGFGVIIILTVFLFIAILLYEFKTFKSTIIVLSVIPLGIVGAVVALLLTGNSLSFTAVVGLIALAGIEVKNTILLVDFTNQLRAQGKSIEESIRIAGEERFLPIILTSLTAIGGLLPIAISTNPLIAPLAIVMIGGLISSTLLSRIVTPVIYKIIPPKI
ncbi:MAG: efflux RND transporter permease subunit [Ignavibacteriales bacterium]|nr:efflux RND transporter permease subunit [Ignavibacteriales bacterium]